MLSKIISNIQCNQEPDNQVEKMSEICPICCMTNFKTTEDLGVHIEDHFNQKGNITLLSTSNYFKETNSCSVM